MAKTIQLRNVPDRVYRKLMARAARAGMTISDYSLRIIRQSAELPTIEEMEARVAQRAPLSADIDFTRDIRAERNRR